MDSNQTSNLHTYAIDLQKLEQDIRPFPATATRIMSLCNSNETKISEITELIECEPAVGVKLLAMANSPLFGATREITCIKHAIVLLGYQTVAQLALSIAAGPLFTSGNPALLKQRTKLFHESLGVATVSRLLASESDIADPSEAFLGGMMLDVGKLFFFDVVPDPYLEILQQNVTGETTDVENSVFGTNHPSIGDYCGRKWGLPHQINNAIKNHHLGMEQVEDGLTKIVLAGSYFAHRWSLGFSDDDQIEVVQTIEDFFPETNLEDLVFTAKEQFQAIQSIFTNQ